MARPLALHPMRMLFFDPLQVGGDGKHSSHIVIEEDVLVFVGATWSMLRIIELQRYPGNSTQQSSWNYKELFDFYFRFIR